MRCFWSAPLRDGYYPFIPRWQSHCARIKMAEGFVEEKGASGQVFFSLLYIVIDCGARDSIFHLPLSPFSKQTFRHEFT